MTFDDQSGRKNGSGRKMMLEIIGTMAWSAAHPGAVIGILEMTRVENKLACAPLDRRKREVEARLRADYGAYSRKEFLSLPLMSAYEQYYRRFDKTYHVLLQVESIARKGKSLPDVSPLVDANFAAEVDSFVLTAGHDAARLVEPVCIDIASDADTLTTMSGETRAIRAGDMVMRDARSVCCTILYGQDNHSPITPDTTEVLYVSYAPRGVPAEIVEAHLRQIERNVRLFSPSAVTAQCGLLRASS